MVEHGKDALERILAEETIRREVEAELHGYLVYILAGAGILHPNMLKVCTRDKHEVILAYNLTAVAHDSSHSWRVLHEVEFKYLMVMYRIGEFLFVTVGYI